MSVSVVTLMTQCQADTYNTEPSDGSLRKSPFLVQLSNHEAVSCKRCAYRRSANAAL